MPLTGNDPTDLPLDSLAPRWASGTIRPSPAQNCAQPARFSLPTTKEFPTLFSRRATLGDLGKLDGFFALLPTGYPWGCAEGI